MDEAASHPSLSVLQDAVAELKRELISHPVYSELQTLEDLRLFMQSHVYAVWDFMSLLKSLQGRLTSVAIPWLPIGEGRTRYLINQIILGEESDVDQQGNFLSHFELYINAMEQADCNTTAINALIGYLKKGFDLQTAIVKAKVPEGAARFMRHTFQCCQLPTHMLAAVFTFGREDLIPAMFLSLVDKFASAHPGKADLFRYYLNRHIEVDGDHHTHLAQEMTAQLCGDDQKKWAEATEAVRAALMARLALWKSITDQKADTHMT